MELESKYDGIVDMYQNPAVNEELRSRLPFTKRHSFDGGVAVKNDQSSEIYGYRTLPRNIFYFDNFLFIFVVRRRSAEMS